MLRNYMTTEYNRFETNSSTVQYDVYTKINSDTRYRRTVYFVVQLNTHAHDDRLTERRRSDFISNGRFCEAGREKNRGTSGKHIERHTFPLEISTKPKNVRHRVL